MKSNLNFLLLKAYTKRYVLLLFLTLGVSVGIGFLCRYDTFRQQTVEKELDGARQKYGTYQICIYGCEREIAQKIVNEDYVVQYSIVDMCVFETEYGMIEACYGDESIFDTMPYQLKYGKFPQNDKQVLCDENGINQLGISEQEIGNGATLSIDGKTYEITGIIKKESLDTDAYLNSFSVVFKQLEQEKNAQIYLQTDSINYKQYKEEICRKYGIQEEYIEDNYDVLTEVRIEDNGALTGMKAGLLFFMKWMLHITIFLLFVFLFLMGKRKYKDVESVIEVLGISKIYSDMIFLMLQCLIFLCSGIMVSFFGVITNTYDKSVAIYKTLYYGMCLFACGFIQCKCEKFHCKTNKVKKIENREKNIIYLKSIVILIGLSAGRMWQCKKADME